ncbi:Tubulin/FtsZ GTPase [Methanoculleus bourgensis MS2]|uniref:Tubulin-like protein CetZ n=1 Tax=Methanoculleus bourgensis (strain ATCC 43281 / DSM 3045 / OCM 15 / MS2) TaxID=1201294 RepID=I7KD89_METBM|nr:cell division protein [Methanoculleus bourgensis]CCJ36596.1 Tubulin/FtsZ GTPase [Methanoculleus bourgensis MS2]
MRVLAIGLGGAGSRIVDNLYDHDRRSKVCCMSAVAIDIDPNSLVQLRHLPESARIFFPPIDALNPDDITSIIDIEEVMTRIQGMDTMEIDAILLCCGLGGSIIDIAPPVIEELRKSYLEPIFALAVLPCLDEGKRVSAKAADDLELLREITDAVILFDNETWSQKIRAAAAAAGKEEIGLMGQIRRNPLSGALNPRDHYDMLNERIARQIGLLLRAGEFNEFGIEVAEVVLDAGEVLNTLKGMGFVAVGYAAERLPTGWLDFFYRRRSLKYFIEGSHEKAARIVSLAKKAVYEEVSVPCDLTSADKALVLIAGPSAELSMKGFQTVRKWIDRSIAGLEMRSGDYPVKNTSFVGIIIVLSGLSNVPRVEELREIRTEYRLEREEERLRAEEEATKASSEPEEEDIPYFASPLETAFLEESDMAEPTEGKDEMIELAGIGRGNRKDRDETIDMLPRPEKKEDDGAIILPPKQGGREVDLAGSASVTSSMPAPKNSVFSPKGISIEKTAPKDDAIVYSASVQPVQRPKDGVLAGDKVSLDPGMQRPIDSVLDEPGIRMREVLPEPKDNLPGGGRRFDRGSPRPKEVDPSRGKLRVIDAAEKPPEEKKERGGDDPGDGGITWIL